MKKTVQLLVCAFLLIAAGCSKPKPDAKFHVGDMVKMKLDNRPCMVVGRDYEWYVIRTTRIPGATGTQPYPLVSVYEFEIESAK